MEVKYHPLVREDVLEILRYYHKISPRLADDVNDELRCDPPEIPPCGPRVQKS